MKFTENCKAEVTTNELKVYSLIAFLEESINNSNINIDEVVLKYSNGHEYVINLGENNVT